MRNNDELFSTILDDFEKEISFSETEKIKNKMHLSVLIDNEIKKKGWSKTYFADLVGQNPSVITKWLSGSHNFTIDTLTDIGLVLGVDLLQIAKHKDNEDYIYTPNVVVVATGTEEAFKKSIFNACFDLTLSSISNSNQTNTTSKKTYYTQSETIS